MATTLLITAVVVGVAAGEYSSTYSCGICRAVADGHSCEKFSACHVVNPRLLASQSCEGLGLCERVGSASDEPRLASPAIDLRVTKGFGTKAYPTLRLSVVTEKGKAPAGFNATGFDYSEQFRYKWTDNMLHSKVVAHPAPGHSATFDVGGTDITVRLPADGEGTAGVIIGDPCVKYSSIISLVGCEYAEKFNTTHHTPAMLNALLQHNDTDFWGLLGDNFYDQSGEATRRMYQDLTLETKTKLFLTVPGNHDYWVLGDNLLGTEKDQYANGHMQWYAMDAKSAEKGDAVFNFSVHPDKGHPVLGGNLPEITNSFWYNQVGNIGWVGYSGAYTFAETKPYLQEACAWLGSKHRSKGGTIDVGILVGHWDKPGGGASKEMGVPELYREISTMPGCDDLVALKALKFFMGHTHCNVPHPHGFVDTGFMVAGQGMIGCGNYGFPIIDTTENRIRVYHFLITDKKTKSKWDTTYSCIRSKGWRACTDLAEVWLDQPFQH